MGRLLRGVPGWSRSVNTAYKEDMTCTLEAAPIAEGPGAMKSAGANAKRLGVFAGVLKERQRLIELIRVV